MDGPNYALLQNLQTLIPEKPRKSPLMQEIIDMQGSIQARKESDMGLALKKAQQGLIQTQAMVAQEEGRLLPEKFQLEKEMHAARMAESNMAMQINKQRQQEMMLDNRLKQAEVVNSLVAPVFNSDPAQQGQIYQQQIKRAQSMGIDVSSFPKEYNQEAQFLVEDAYKKSGAEAAQLKQQLELAKIQPVKIIKDGKVMYVRPDQAVGQEAFDKDAMKEQQDPIAAEVPKYKAKELSALNERWSQEAQAADNLRNEVRAFQGAVQQMPFETGAKYAIPGSAYTSSAAQNAQQISEKLTLESSKFLKGALSDRDMDTLRRSVPSIKNHPEANLKITDRIETGALRAQQKPLFIQTMQENGIYDPVIIEAQWNRFAKENPLFDDQGGTNKNNIDNWEEYITNRSTKKTKEIKTPKNAVKSILEKYTYDDRLAEAKRRGLIQ